MNVWFNSLLAVFIVSLISLIGIFFIFLKADKLNKMILLLVSFSVGALFADAFIHIIPEVVETYGFDIKVALFLLSGVLSFFVLEKFIHWRHCHVPTSKEHPHSLGLMNLVGDGFHNFIDGLIIGGSFLVNSGLGIATTIAVIAHEIPQEIGEFGILLHAGYSKKKALFFNFLSALTAFLGVILSLTFLSKINNSLMFLLPFTAGGFLYLAGSDLIPELKKEIGLKNSFYQFIFIIIGIGLMVALKILLE